MRPCRESQIEENFPSTTGATPRETKVTATSIFRERVLQGLMLPREVHGSGRVGSGRFGPGHGYLARLVLPEPYLVRPLKFQKLHNPTRTDPIHDILKTRESIDFCVPVPKSTEAMKESTFASTMVRAC